MGIYIDVQSVKLDLTSIHRDQRQWNLTKMDARG